MRVTFDTNVWNRMVFPERRLDNPNYLSLRKIKRAIRSGQVRGFISEGFGTVEAVGRKNQAKFHAQNVPTVEVTSKSHGKSLIWMTIEIKANHGLHPGIGEDFEGELNEALAIGIKLLTTPYIGLPVPDRLRNNPHIYAEEVFATANYNERFGDVARAIVDRRVGEGALLALAREFTARLDGPRPDGPSDRALIYGVYEYARTSGLTKYRRRIEKAFAESADALPESLRVSRSGYNKGVCPFGTLPEPVTLSRKNFNLLSLNHVSMRFGARVLFEDVTTTFLSGRRYAISGPNGAGKSTLMRILTGEIEPSKGSVTRPKKLGVLRQDQFAFDSYRVLDTVIMGNPPLWAALQDREALYSKPHDELTDEDGMRLGELEGTVGNEGGYTAESDAAVLLDGLDIGEQWHHRRMSELQGGQKVRVLLAQALFGNPSVLLLDEPTNHLDLESVHWLQDYLLEYEGCLIVISHDRHFLNEVCTHVADIDYETVITYTGGYDDMVLAKTQIRSRVEAENAQREKKIAQLTEFIARFSAGTRSSQVTSRKKEVERLQTAELAKSNIQRPYIRFGIDRASGRHPLEVKELSKSYAGVDVIDKFTANVSRGEKVALIGRNGAGKTTLLRSLVRNAPGPIDEAEREFGIDSGTVTWGHEVSVGYFSQDHRQSIRVGLTLIDWLHQFDPMASQAELRAVLGQMLFSGNDAVKRTEALSGGEAARLMFCRLMLEKPNVLLLDEPTNHLDLESINALNIALQRYEGTVLLVTHDHDVIDEVASRIWSFANGAIEDFQGPYEEFRAAAAKVA